MAKKYKSLFSRRTSWNTTPNALVYAVNARRAQRKEILDLTVSNPTVVNLPYSQEDILSALCDPRGGVYQPDPLGHPEARQAVAKWYQQRGVQVDASQVVLTASTSEAYGYLFSLLADAGDEILVPAPSYPLFGFLADLCNVRLGVYPLSYDGAWYIDIATLQQRITPRTRAIVTVSPNNPTGSYLKQNELRALQHIAKEHNLALINDEVFSDYSFSICKEPSACRSTRRGAQPTAAQALRVMTLAGERDSLSFALSGLSKVAALPQLKLAWVVVAGGDPQVAAALERLTVIADTYLSVNTPVQLGLSQLLESSPRRAECVRARTATNLRILQQLLQPPSPATVLMVEGGWCATVRLPTTHTEEEWVLALLERGVLTHPGFFFDFSSEAYLVLSLLPEEGVFHEGVSRLRDLVCAFV